MGITERYGAPLLGDEKAVLMGMLDHYRATIVEICRGLSEADLRRPMVLSGTTLLGLVKHLAFVEGGWFEEVVGNRPATLVYDDDDPDMDFRIEPDETSEQIFEMYRAACARSNAILAEVSLDDVSEWPGRSYDCNVRWVLAHMLEETARHTGHADILREMIDGKIGHGYSPALYSHLNLSEEPEAGE